MNHAIHYKNEYEYKYTGGFHQNIFRHLLEKEEIPKEAFPYRLNESKSGYETLKIIYLNNNLSREEKYELTADKIYIVSEKVSLYKMLSIAELPCLYKFKFDKSSPNYPFPIEAIPTKEIRVIYPWPVLVVTGKEPISKILTVCGVFTTGASAKAAGYLKPIPIGDSQLKVGKASGIFGFTKREFEFYIPE